MKARVSTALVVLAAVLLVAAGLAGYARRALFDSDRFADRAAASLQDAGVRTVIGDRVTDELILRNEPDLIAARPLIASAVSGIVSGAAFRSLFRRAVLDAHRAVFARDQDTVTLTLVDVGTVAAAALQELRPQLAQELADSGRVELLSARIGAVTGDLARTARRVRALSLVLALLTVAAAVGALALSPDRRRTAQQLGVGLAAAGIAIVVIYTVARGVVLAGIDDPDDREAAAGVWHAFLGGLLTLGGAIAATGAIVAAAASSVLRPIDLRHPLREVLARAFTEPARPAVRATRAGALVVAGVLLIAYPLVALKLAAQIGGLWLIYLGVDAALRLVYRPAEDQQRPRRRRSHALAGALVVAALVAVGVSALLAGGVEDAPAARTAACNGHVDLCAKKLADVVLPATHNSMSVPLPGWASAEQEKPIPGQLADGIRGLLLDTHYGDKLENGRVRTYFGSRAQLEKAATQDGVSPAAVESALRLRGRLGFQGEGVRDMYLCHTFCELGATRLDEVLDEIHAFLATNPGEVVVIVNQDYVTPEDFVKAIGDAGLTRYAATDLDRTLREMIDSDQRLVLLAENHAGAAPWYQLAYEKLVEETPFHFSRTAQLTDPALLPASCRPNRGPESAPLFLFNHWITTSPVQRPSDAATINAYEPLMARVRECERIRDHIPNLLAVNFYLEGDVFKVADALNR